MKKVLYWVIVVTTFIAQIAVAIDTIELPLSEELPLSDNNLLKLQISKNLKSLDLNNFGDKFTEIQIRNNLSSMPLTFTKNEGQWDSKVQFCANVGGATMWFSSDGAYYQFARAIESEAENISVVPINSPNEHESKLYETMMIKASFVGANLNPQMVGVDMIDYKCNYFIGNNESKWATDVPNYSAVIYEDIYSGIDLKYYGNGKQMEYDFIVEPGVDYSQIQISYEGAESIDINDKGDLVVTTKWGNVVEQKPYVYQMINGEREPIYAEYILKGENEFGFVMLKNYNQELALIIDPVLEYSTYLGGIGAEYGYDMAVDDSGSAYVVGYTASPDFPTTALAIDTTYEAGDVFVSKFSSDGSSLIYSTYLGGSGIDYGYSIAVDVSGAAYITGQTNSGDYPMLNPYQMDQGFGDAFVTKLSSAGNSLVYSTYLGGSGAEGGSGIAVDDFGAAYVTGATASTDFPTLNAYQVTFAGGSGGGDVFVTKFSSSGSSIIYSTFIGGVDADIGHEIVVDVSGVVFVTGYNTINRLSNAQRFARYIIRSKRCFYYKVKLFR